MPTTLVFGQATATFADKTERMHTVDNELKKRWRKPSGFEPRRPHKWSDLRKRSDGGPNDRVGIRAGRPFVHILLTVSLTAAFAWFAPTGWLLAAQYAVIPPALLLVAICARWAYMLRDEGGGGDDGHWFDPAPWSPDPGGLDVDWDRELEGLLADEMAGVK